MYTCESTKTKGMRVLHSSTFDNRNVTKNNGPQYLRLEILHSVHYTRKTQNIEHEHSTIHFSSLSSTLRLVFTRWESDVSHNAQQCNDTVTSVACWRLKASLSSPFDEGVGRASIFYASIPSNCKLALRDTRNLVAWLPLDRQFSIQRMRRPPLV